MITRIAKILLGELYWTQVPTVDFSPSDLNEMWELYSQYNERPRSEFEEAIQAQEFILQLRKRSDNSLQGMFSFTPHFFGDDLVLYIGSLLLARAYRDKGYLQRIGVKLFLKYRLRYINRRIYLAASCNSHNSYLLIAGHLDQFWPRHNEEMPEGVEALRNSFASRIYKDRWVRGSGVVRKGELRVKNCTRPNRKALKNPNISFFYEMNPKYDRGESLMCIMPLDSKNYFSILANVAKEARKKRQMSKCPHQTLATNS